MTDTRRLDPVLEPLRSSLALMLWEAEAIKVRLEEPFQLASGNYSPIYVNCRQVISDPAFMGLAAAVARVLCVRRALRFDAVAGGETAGIPYAAYIAQALDRSMLYVRKKPKGHGIATQVEGSLRSGSRVLLVEDLITDGGSKDSFIAALRAAGATVTDALVLFDRVQGGGAALASQQVRLHALTDRESALAAAVASERLEAAAAEAVSEYFRNPEAWHERRGLSYRSG
ncbi:MAG: orotate phosphoribosyltransferase [Acidobacteriota bacterium]